MDLRVAEHAAAESSDCGVATGSGRVDRTVDPFTRNTPPTSWAEYEIAGRHVALRAVAYWCPDRAAPWRKVDRQCTQSHRWSVSSLQLEFGQRLIEE
jgi:hypothetical protein